MKKLLTASLLLASLNASATVLDFEGISSLGNTGYGGLSWSSDWGVLNATQGSYVNSGYNNGLVSGTNVAYNGYAQVVSVNDTAFDWNGAFFTGAWNDGLSVQAIGYVNGVETYNQTIVVDTSGPSWFDANFMGITSLVLSSFGGIDNPEYGGSGAHFAMDNFTFNEAFDVSEPSTLALLGLGLLGFGFSRRSKA